MRKISLCALLTPLTLWALLTMGLLGGALPLAASSTGHDFEAEVPDAWSEDKTHEVGGSTVLGLFNQRNDDYPDDVTLRIEEGPAPEPLSVEFDLVLLGNWDSEGAKADRFEVLDNNGGTLLEVTEFSCGLTDEDENLPPKTPGATKVGRRYMRHCVLHKSFVVPAGTEEITFRGTVTGRRSEFWALDNVRLAKQQP